jgi:hypothetical protein
LPAPEIQRVHYGESFPGERLQKLQHARQVARQHAEQQGLKYKANFDRNTAPHKFTIHQKVWLSDTTALGKNPKLTPKWLGPYKIVDLNDNNATLEIKTNKYKVVNIARLKPFCEDPNKSVCQEDMCFSESDSSLFQDTNTNCPQRPMTRALKKLLDYKNAATMAISILHQDCDYLQDPYTSTKNYTQYCCDKCYSAFKNMKFNVKSNVCADPTNLIKFLQKFNEKEGTFTSALCDLIKNYKYCKNDVDQVQHDADPIKKDQPVIAAIKKALREKLTSIASKLLSSEHTKLEDLSEEEQDLWKQFDNSDIYEFITGKQDTLPEFQYDWIEPCQLAVHLPPGVLLAARPDLQPPPDQNKPPMQPAQPAAPAALPAQPAQPAPPPQLAQPQDQPVAQFQQVPDQAPVAGPSGRQQQVHQHNLRPRQDLNYKERHTGIKQRCRKLRRQAKAVITKLAPGSFLPKQPPPGPSSQNMENPGPSSSLAPFSGPVSFNFLLNKPRNRYLLILSFHNRTNYNYASVLWETTRPPPSSATSESRLTTQLFFSFRTR